MNTYHKVYYMYLYISQTTLEDRKYLEYLITRSKQVGINTFVIDLNRVSNTYEKNILLVKNSLKKCIFI